LIASATVHEINAGDKKRMRFAGDKRKMIVLVLKLVRMSGVGGRKKNVLESATGRKRLVLLLRGEMRRGRLMLSVKP
jgi:hypothetical protein